MAAGGHLDVDNDRNVSGIKVNPTLNKMTMFDVNRYNGSEVIAFNVFEPRNILCMEK
jgi:hypothetical protein